MSSPLKAMGKSTLGAFQKSTLGARTAGGPVNYHIWYSSHIAIQFFDFNPSTVLVAPEHPHLFQMDNVVLEDGGSGYTEAPDVTTEGGLFYTDARNKAGLEAVFEAEVDGISLTSAGMSYAHAPRVVISGGGGAGAKAEASLNPDGSIEKIEVTDRGHGYKEAPDVSFEDQVFLTHPPNPPALAAATAEISGKVVDVIINGMRGFYGYLGTPTTPRIVFSGGGGSGASARAVMSESIIFPDNRNLYGLNPDLYATNSADTLYDKITRFGDSFYFTIQPLRSTDSSPMRFRIWAYQEKNGTGEVFVTKLDWDESPSDEDLDGLDDFKGRVQLNGYSLDRGQDYPNSIRSETLMKPDIEIRFDEYEGGIQDRKVREVGTVCKITMTNQGVGYHSTPAVSLTGGGGSGATGRVVMDGSKVRYVEVVDGGHSYTSAPTVTFTGGSPTTPAAATAKVNLAGEIKTWELGKEIEIVQDEILGMMGYSVSTESNQLEYDLDDFNNRYPTLGRFKGFGLDAKVYGKLLNPDKYQDPYLKECPTHVDSQGANIEAGKPYNEYVGLLVTLVPGKYDNDENFEPHTPNGQNSVIPTFWLDGEITGNDYHWYYLLTKNLHGTEEFTTSCGYLVDGPSLPQPHYGTCEYLFPNVGWLHIPPCVDDGMIEEPGGTAIRFIPALAAGASFWFPGGGGLEVTSSQSVAAAGLYSAYGPNNLTATIPYGQTAGGPDGQGAFARCGDDLASGGSVYCGEDFCKWYIFYKSVFDSSTEDGTINPSPENYFYLNPSIYFAGVDGTGSYWVERSTHRLYSISCIPNGMYGTDFFPDPAFHDIPYYPPATEWEWFFDHTGPTSKRRWAQLAVDTFVLLGHRDTPATAVPRQAWYPVMGVDSWYGGKAFYKFPFTLGTFNYLYGGYFSASPNLDNYYNYYGIRIFSTTVSQSIASMGMYIAQERFRLLIDSLPGAEQVMQHIRQAVQQDANFMSGVMQAGGDVSNFGGVVAEMMPPGYVIPQYFE